MTEATSAQLLCPQCGNSRDNPREDPIDRMLMCADPFHSQSARPQLPPLPVPYRQEPPVYSMIPVQQRDKWKKKWSRMDDEGCEPHHYKHYEWECRKVFEELEARERQLLSVLAENESLKAQYEELRKARQLVVDDLSEALDAGIEFDETHGIYKNVRAEKVEAKNESLKGQLSEARAGCVAWECAVSSLKAHLQDRIAMKDESRPDIYLSILQSDVANVARDTKQIRDATWHRERIYAARAEKAEAERDQALGVIREYRWSQDRHRDCGPVLLNDDDRCPTCIKADVLLSPEPKG